MVSFQKVWCDNSTLTHEALFLIPFLFNCPRCIVVLHCVLGGCTVIMFGSIMMSGIRMMQNAGLDQRNVLIAATSLCLGVGVTQVEGFFDNVPPVFGEIFAGNMVAGVFVVGLILELCLPKDPKRYETR